MDETNHLAGMERSSPAPEDELGPVSSADHVNESDETRNRVSLIPAHSNFVPPTHRSTWQRAGRSR